MRSSIRRFTFTEIAYHWAQALPYLLLAASGAGLLVGPHLGLSPGHRLWLAWLHRLAGVCLVLLLLQVALSGRARVLWGNLLESLRWGRDDLRWLYLAGRSLLHPQTVLPIAGKFNAGQKLNLLASFTFVLLFVATGAAIWWRPTALLPRAVHTALFVLAAPFLLGHLYMALFNPSTRQAIAGIFHGRVDAEYARRHHERWYGECTGEPVEARPAGVRGPLALARLALLAVGLLAGLALLFGFRAPLARAGRKAATLHPLDALEPGALMAAHASPAIACLDCHSLLQDVAEAKCLKCHDTVRERRVAGAGYHGRHAQPCTDCHSDHRGDAFETPLPAGFRHDQTEYPLIGAHRGLKCEQCHVRRGGPTGPRFIGTPNATCDACHADPHRAQFDPPCTRCHTTRGWKGRELRFDHGRDSAFRLEGAHAGIECSKCHAGERLASAQFHWQKLGCPTCHSDPHQGQLGTQCSRCHTQSQWQSARLLFAHDRDSRFPLTGRHRTTPCAKCHRHEANQPLAAARFKPLPTACADCHPDPHEGHLKTQCERCHTTEGWTGRHVALPAGAPQDVRSVADCTACHTQDLEKPVPLNKVPASVRGQATRFLHSNHPRDKVACAQCHPMKAKGVHVPLKPYDAQCSDCHHNRQQTVACAQCHRETADYFAGRFEGRLIGKGRHGRSGAVRCQDCHRYDAAARRFAPTESACENCHPASYTPVFLKAKRDWQAWQASLRDRPLSKTQRAALRFVARNWYHNDAHANRLRKRFEPRQ